MRILFFGSPLFAVPTLKSLAAEADIDIIRVFTQPDKGAGRGRKLRPPAVKTAAEELGLPAEQPERIRGRKFRQHCQSLEADAFVVVAFGKIFPGKLLAVPPLGCVNLHSSLLPELRGAAPINWAIVRGYQQTGCTTMLMDEGMDTGPMLLQELLEIGDDETAPQLAERLAAQGGPMMVRTLHGLADGSIEPRNQDDRLATHAPLISKEDGKIDWNQNASDIYNAWRGFYPWPGVFTSFRGEVLKIKELRPADIDLPESRRGLLIPSNNHLFATCGNHTAVELLSLQLPGKRPLPPADFVNGVRLKEPEKLQ